MLRWVWSVNKFGWVFLQTQALMGEFTEKKNLRKKMHQSQISYESAIFKILKSNEDKNFKINSHNYMYQRDTKWRSFLW